MNNKLILEQFDAGDLHRMILPVLSIDRFKSKMGEDCDIVVIALQALGEAATNDLVSHLETTFSFILDADSSNNEDSVGYYTIFIELERKHGVDKKICKIINNLLLLTKQNIKEWKFNYSNERKLYPLTMKNIRSKIELSPKKYKNLSGITESLNLLRLGAGIPIKSKKITDEELINLQRIARII